MRRMRAKRANHSCTFGVQHAVMTDNALQNLAALLSVTHNPPWFNDSRKHRCAYCGEATGEDLGPGHKLRTTRDHILAKAQGGRVTVPACRACNARKKDRPFPEFMADAETAALRARPVAKPWPEHELWAVYAAAVLRKTHALMSAKPPHSIAPAALSSSARGERNKQSTAFSASGSVPSSPSPARKASAGTSVPRKARARV